MDVPVAAAIPSGGAPSDIDADGDVLGVVDHIAGASHLTQFTMNGFGELSDPITVDAGATNANGVAIMPALDTGDDAQ